jgi:hypothetical protein
MLGSSDETFIWNALARRKLWEKKIMQCLSMVVQWPAVEYSGTMCKRCHGLLHMVVATPFCTHRMGGTLIRGLCWRRAQVLQRWDLEYACSIRFRLIKSVPMWARFVTCNHSCITYAHNLKIRTWVCPYRPYTEYAMAQLLQTGRSWVRLHFSLT